jgi:uncharacterized phage protein (TIGR01671 family)
MRKIKYRVWDSINELMYPVSQLSWDEHKDGILRLHFSGWTLMQYIGLKDKNHNEIYEGDIVNFDNSDIGGDKVTGEVIFNTDPTLSNLEWGLWTKKGYYSTDFLGTIEVIGNIYQNKELVK